MDRSPHNKSVTSSGGARLKLSTQHKLSCTSQEKSSSSRMKEEKIIHKKSLLDCSTNSGRKASKSPTQTAMPNSKNKFSTSTADASNSLVSNAIFLAKQL